MMKHTQSKKQIIKFFTQYGIHIWAILIIANAVMVYTYHFATHAAGKNDIPIHSLQVNQTPSPSGQVSPSPSGTQVSPSAAPQGPSIYLDFTVPGIGSGGGTMKPVHPERNVTVYLYGSSVNSMDPHVNPLYTIQGTATFDANPESPTYTSFVNPVFDLGSNIPNGSYQIAFRTDLSFTTLIKQNPSDIGGEVFSLNSQDQPIQIPPQTVLMGDSIPSGNNYSFTINDYNAFINCYGNKDTTNSFCKGKNYADFNDDGVVDGIDYNILIRSLSGLVQQGQTLPAIRISPTTAVIKPIHTSKLTVSPPKIKPTFAASTSAKTIQASKKAGSAVGVVFVFLFLIILVGIGVVLYFKNEKIHNTINALIHLSPTGTPEEQSTEATEEQPAVEEAPPPTAPTKQPAVQAPPAEPTPAAAPAEEVIEKDCYIKKKGPDESGTGMWLLLTDDNGAINAHYAKNDVNDGFAKVKGVMKTENGKKFMEISEIFVED